MPSALEDALNLLGAVRERASDLRTRRRLVLWGGRPGLDVQYRGIDDRRRHRRQELLARLSPLAQAILTTSDNLATIAPQIAAIMLEQRRAYRRAGIQALIALERLQAIRAQDTARAAEALARFHTQTRPPSDAARRSR